MGMSNLGLFALYSFAHSSLEMGGRQDVEKTTRCKTYSRIL